MTPNRLPRRPMNLIVAGALSLLVTATGPAWSGEDAGAYLAARVASLDSNFQAASDYFTRALAADPANPVLASSALLADVALGEFDKARKLAAGLATGGENSGLSDLVILAGLAKDGKFQEAVTALDEGRSAGTLVDGLFRAWAQVGAGQVSDALKSFDAVAKTQGLGPFALYHKALALALVGDFEGADKILSGEAAGPVGGSRRGIIAHVEILSQLERDADAIALLDRTVGPESRDPALVALRADLEAGKTVPFNLINGPRDGLAEVFLAVASVLADTPPPPAGEGADAPRPVMDVLMFSRTAEYLRPDLTDAQLLLGQTLRVMGQYDLAIATFDKIGPDSPDRIEADLARGEALVAAGQMDAAIAVLQDLVKAVPDRPALWAGLGDLYRRAERFQDGAEAYSKAIGLVGEPKVEQWPLYYARAICYERLKEWDRAEPDFRQALKLSPDQPDVLNYLGYSFLEMDRNLDEAVGMIEKAAAAAPKNGAIIDSLGWAFYLTGKYPDAERELEKAIELMPNDPVVNDHLGDVYWMVGRKLEAEFQWRRALSFKPEQDEVERIRRKLEVGLDAVLKEEGGPPMAKAPEQDKG